MTSLVSFVRNDCNNLEFKGVMTIGSPLNSNSDLNTDFIKLVECRSKLQLENEVLELSMGMSDDYEQAIAAGSTNVRIGSKLFGSRT